MIFINSLEFARSLDAADPLAGFRNCFHFPMRNGKGVMYFCGNSLGLQPKTAKAHLEQELRDWAELAVDGHLNAGHPWYSYHEWFAGPLSRLTGAHPHEVVAMNALTVNLHILLSSFYRPNGKRFKILCEDPVFPSDLFALRSHILWHGLDPEKTLVRVQNPEAAPEVIRRHGDALALVFIGGVNYFTGEVVDMEAITKAAHAFGALAGFDQAHAIGNIPMRLHDWNVDFAVWCSYKYLNSGPGSVGGAFVHERHHGKEGLPRLHGWWGHDSSTRFQMPALYSPALGADAWQISNAPVLNMACHRASLEIFDEAGIENLRKKSMRLTGYLEFVIQDVIKNTSTGKKMNIRIITPSAPEQRGCQLSLVIEPHGRKIHEWLCDKYIVADWREPSVIRMAPVPLYNTFEDVYRFGKVLEGCLM